MEEAFKTASTRIEPRPTCLWQQTGCSISCYPSPGPREHLRALQEGGGFILSSVSVSRSA